MKKVITICVFGFSLLFSSDAVSEIAWGTDDYANKLGALPDSFKELPEPVMFYGRKSGSIWQPVIVSWDKRAGTFVSIEDIPVTQCDTYISVVRFGTYNPIESYDFWLANFNEEVFDSKGNKIGERLTDADVETIYRTLENLNIAKAKGTLADIVTMYDKYMQEQKEKIAGGEGSDSKEEISETTGKVDEALDDYDEDSKKELESAKEESNRLKQELVELQNKIARYDEERAQLASEQALDAAKSIDEAQRLLIEGMNEGNIEKIKDAKNVFTDGYNKLTESISNLSSVYGEGVQGYVNSLNDIRARTGRVINHLNNVQRPDDEHAQAARNECDGYSSQLDDAKNNESIMVGKHKIDKGELRRAELLVNHAIFVMAELENIREDLSNAGRLIIGMCNAYMTDMNTIGAYLGSTNAMEYFSTVRKADELDKEEFKRWFGFSVPEKIDDAYGFGASQYGGRRWNFIYDNLASTYMTWAWPLGQDDSGDPQPGFLKFMEHFNLSGLAPRYKGFVESINYDSEEHPQTNWVANGITAPKNWADGSTIKVTNGVFVASSKPITFKGTETSQEVGEGITNFVFESASDSNVKVWVEEDEDHPGTAKIKIGVYWK